MKVHIWILFFLVLLSGCTMRKEEVLLDQQASFEETIYSDVSAQLPEPEIVKQELFTMLINPRNEDFVRVKDYIPEIITEQQYSTPDNFTGQSIYDFEDVFLRYGTVMKLLVISEELKQQGLGIKIWDGFRPVSAQFKLWEVCPDDTYVANPNKGFSNHSRGFAVDVTLVDSEGKELEMPTGFDDFSPLADRDYSDCSETAAKNAVLLENVMQKHGFVGYAGEWWHFNDSCKYDVETCFDPALITQKYTSETTELLCSLWEPSSEILKIPQGQPVTLLGYCEEYSMVEYWGYRGYVATEKLQDNA